jgi:lysophospholipase L1-like esterase
MHAQRISWLAIFPLICGASLLAETPSAGPLQKGERIVFLGDSITQAGAGPNGYVTLVRESLKASHPDLGIEVIGAGISGNKVPDLERRLEKDVLAKKPTLVVIYIGINDVWHSQSGRGTPKEAFDKGLRSLIEQIRAAGARVVLCTASVIGEKTDGSNPLDKMLDEYCAVSREVAASTKTPLLDLRKAFLDHLKAHNSKNESKGLLTSDTVHLNAAGNQFVAEQMLAALGAAKTTSAKAAESKLLRHVVFFKFKDDVSKEQVQEVVAAFAAMRKTIDVIHDFEWGTDVGVENLSAGFTHAFIVTFKSEKDRDAYLPHPVHEEFKKLAIPRIDKVLVIDFWAQQ